MRKALATAHGLQVPVEVCVALSPRERVGKPADELLPLGVRYLGSRPEPELDVARERTGSGSQSRLLVSSRRLEPSGRLDRRRAKARFMPPAAAHGFGIPDASDPKPRSAGPAE